MLVLRQLGNAERVRLFAAGFSEGEAAANVDRSFALAIREPEIDSAITTERCTQQRKERLVLVYGKELSVTKRPAFGREAKTHDAYFRQKRFCHYLLLVLGSRVVHQLLSVRSLIPSGIYSKSNAEVSGSR